MGWPEGFWTVGSPRSGWPSTTAGAGSRAAGRAPLCTALGSGGGGGGQDAYTGSCRAGQAARQAQARHVQPAQCV